MDVFVLILPLPLTEVRGKGEQFKSPHHREELCPLFQISFERLKKIKGGSNHVIQMPFWGRFKTNQPKNLNTKPHTHFYFIPHLPRNITFVYWLARKPASNVLFASSDKQTSQICMYPLQPIGIKLKKI